MATAWDSLGAPPTGARQRRIAGSPHYDRARGRFLNSLPAVQPRLGPILGDWVRDGIRGRAKTRPDLPIPLFHGTRAVLARPPASDLRVTWLGHSTMLVELDGVRLLTDPVWSERAAPWEFMGPSRFHPPPLALDELPALDAVVISHDHYDHLDAAAIRVLAARAPRFVVPLGVGSHLERWGVAPEAIVELDWWGAHEVAGVTLVATPARHFSGRSLRDRDATLWAGWAMIGASRRVYFSGDTAMFPGFRDIGQRLGPFDLTMIESGAYNQRWADYHLGPEQAARAHVDVRGRLMMPVHWGTFELALHAWTEPVERLQVATRAAGVSLVVPRPGQSVEPDDPPPLERWWPEIPWQTAEQYPVRSSGLDHERGPQGLTPGELAALAAYE